jgi:rhodanese-related sulfurtransferase
MAAENVVEGLVDLVHWHDLDTLDDDVALVDCRPPEMREAEGFIEESLNVPLPTLRNRVDDLPDEVVAYCKMGQTSYMACRAYDQYGIEASNLSGGFALYDAVRRDRRARAEESVVKPPVRVDE